MKTVKTSATFKTDLISLGDVVRLCLLDFPVAVSDIINTGLKPEAHKWTGRLEEGDVSLEYTFLIWKNGLWSFSVKLHDSGTIAGDFYVVEATFLKDQHVGTSIDGGPLKPDQTFSDEKHGQDRWIKDNWETIIKSGVRIKLTVTPDIGSVVATIGMFLTLGTLAIFSASGKPHCIHSDPDNPNGGVVVDTDCE
jgi:hypothetical protein